MSASLNQVSLIGNLTRDPEMKYTEGGNAVVSFRIATNSSWTDKNGQKQEEVEFHNLQAWGKLAEICQKYLKKGSKVFVQGRIKTESWEKSGVKNYRTKVVIKDMVMLSPKGESNQRAESQQYDQGVVSQEVDPGDIPL